MLFDNESASPAGVSCVSNRTQQAVDNFWGEAEGKFIRKQELWLTAQGTGQSKHLLFSPGQHPPANREPRLKFREKLQSPLYIATANSQVVASGHLSEDQAVFGNESNSTPNPLVHRGVGRNVIEKHDPINRSKFACDRLQSCGFSRPIWTK